MFAGQRACTGGYKTDGQENVRGRVILYFEDS